MNAREDLEHELRLRLAYRALKRARESGAWLDILEAWEAYRELLSKPSAKEAA